MHTRFVKICKCFLNNWLQSLLPPPPIHTQLAEVEGKNFELTDRVSDLEQQLEGFKTDDSQSQGGEHEEITRLEEQLESKERVSLSSYNALVSIALGTIAS